MTTSLGRLTKAVDGIKLIVDYINDYQLTEQAQVRTPQYLVRAAIIKEFEAVAENLNLPSSDPIRQSHLDF
ncbi:hypothetical protein HETIRDRAFT_109022 [Heterobasidion irregulare TC 32-1]|uniref:Uncharacterized protein n=1 Tax=Heterobasidion irregulare (strain TC 32-1) TaxID=747525 RepID=W4JXW6_HETIT|nr:uncharacterized protein HETIRDRAFT_109022 [Heterobasidion irregulare TC 32-1]ETW78422.1 hypothetical protein HETIRDRAFT_109022 [Heterobasidion irregulare TC 32-1]